MGKSTLAKSKRCLPVRTTCIRTNRPRSALHKRPSSEQCIGATKLRPSLIWRARTNCPSTWTAPVSPTQSHRLTARPTRSRGRLELTSFVLEGQKMERLVIFFDKKISREFDYRAKQAGHLGSKMRFLAAQWLGLLNRDAWLRNAQHANRAARGLATRLRMEAGIESVFPVDANAVFVVMDERLASALHARGWRFYKFIEPDVYRLMCSWSTTGEQISGLLADIVAIK